MELDSEAKCEEEAIVGNRLFMGKLQFIAFFVGYDTSENMWLAEEYLSKARKLLTEYQATYQV